MQAAKKGSPEQVDPPQASVFAVPPLFPVFRQSRQQRLRHPRRMRGRVDGLQRPNAHLRVNLRRLQAGVPQHRLDIACVRAILQHQRRHRVPEQMAGTLLPDGRFRDVLLHQNRQVIGLQRVPQGIQEQRSIVLESHQLRPCPVPVGRDPGQRPIPNGNYAVLLALALADHHRSPLPVHVLDRQPRQLHPPNPRGIKGFENRPVSQADRRIHVGHPCFTFGLHRGRRKDNHQKRIDRPTPPESRQGGSMSVNPKGEREHAAVQRALHGGAWHASGLRGVRRGVRPIRAFNQSPGLAIGMESAQPIAARRTRAQEVPASGSSKFGASLSPGHEPPR